MQQTGGLRDWEDSNAFDFPALLDYRVFATKTVVYRVVAGFGAEA
jgi:hypothetical protein